MNIVVRNFPNLITLINLAGGVCAIIFASRGFAEIGKLEAWQWSCICIAIAAFADFFDGFTARLLHAYSNLGKELDSLCDMVSFGVAPTVILFNVARECSAPGWLGWFTLAIPLAGALRLAKFNIDDRQSSSFIGLPIPANAIFWIGYCALAAKGVPLLFNPAVFLATVLIESWLMISPIRLFSLKFKTFGWRGNEARYLLIVAAALFVGFLQTSGLLWLVLFYILLSLFPFAREV
ncbi:MAG: CDP-diacylglycerol--serine O-phosphatidyltransferase [Clostridium sp.]|nr:CDP-diacylglycerol--serine O-phosphatidyltransferase [Prevotella sp.]MCM1428992.1 CDP-diacylglycerol--serine O-phosphatidyltransferase [Clostridium sp.]MCM1475478.1 CDP-diacylglycerol--serine O-phosphatidyltransferase [Muribaculaceae bacterium]